MIMAQGTPNQLGGIDPRYLPPGMTLVDYATLPPEQQLIV